MQKAPRDSRHRARHVSAALLLSLASVIAGTPQAQAADLDRNTVGAWVLPINSGRWLWEIDADGSYRFHSEAADGIAPHAGKFSASGGIWSLAATNGYADGGPYLYQAPDALTATGRLGTATWHRLANLDNDPDTIGTWQLLVNGKPWIWEIHTDGTYAFHSEAGDGVPPQSGKFAASAGYWWLEAANGYADGGTYTLQPPDSFTATGKLGTALWRHASAGSSAGDGTASGNDSDPCWVKALEANMQTGQGQQCK